MRVIPHVQQLITCKNWARSMRDAPHGDTEIAPLDLLHKMKRNCPVFSIRWIMALAIAGLAACLSSAPNEASQRSAEPGSNLFSSSAASAIEVGTKHIPASANTQKTPARVPGGICMRMSAGGSKILVSWKPIGCWGSGCYKIIEKELHLRIEASEERPDCTTEPINTQACQPIQLSALHVSSSVKVERHPKRKICARDCSGIGRMFKSIAYTEASPINVIHKGRPVGRFDPTNARYQCFKPGKRNIYRGARGPHHEAPAKVDQKD